ncbi:polyamine ABC transporter substrate-binding protein [Nesterenkonia xinjiangensis]|uniref:Spermidine/putrescine transport system substrate-binding protein n=1 Tax=Nesterenkonia xinjiangensis TaxID=225327 RepID=A0A7Z0KA45_9MICC|nr:spermidine/putrescine ABC transporter substrate-binding protein [Nesterenkonia xinjiangensis]NYJ78438.1 spermidine/putrescine transport system substrate-binding protein [Nesterenkonia xinjiangensis]
MTRRQTPLPPDPMIRSLVRSQLASRRMSRRHLMAGAGAAGLLGALTACGTGGTTTTDDGPAEDLSEETMELFWANWSLYLDYDGDSGSYPTLDRFQEETGISVTYAEDIDGNESYYGTIQNQLRQGQNFGQDLITFTDWMAGRVIAAGQVRELDHGNIPHLENLLPGLQDVGFDPERRHSITWQSGMTGLAWNREAVPDGVHTVTDLLTNPDLRGRVVVLDEWRDTMSLIMLDQGADITSFDAADFESALEVLEEGISSGQIRQVRGNAYMEDLVSGDALAVMGWSGDITQLNLEEGDRWDFALPEAGGTLWSDNLLIPNGAEHKSNAERLMNFYLDPEIAAEVAAYVNFVCPVQGAQEAMEAIDPELAEDPLIFPTEEMQENLHIIRGMDTDEEAEFTDMFQAVIGN